MISLHLNITPDMRDAKTRFWKALEVNPICDPDHVSLAAAMQLTKEPRIKAWWEKPGFSNWFSAGNEYEVKLSSAKCSAIDTLLDVMGNPETPASARVAAAKAVMEHAKALEKDDSSVENLLEKIAGVNNVEDLKKYLK